jgi:hypothetical protein
LFSVLPEPTKFTFAYSVDCSFSHSLARQQTISVIESPNGMYRIVALVDSALVIVTRRKRRRVWMYIGAGNEYEGLAVGYLYLAVHSLLAKTVILSDSIYFEFMGLAMTLEHGSPN